MSSLPPTLHRLAQRPWFWAPVLCLAALCALASCSTSEGSIPTEQDGKALKKLIEDVQQVRYVLALHPPPKKKMTEGALTADQRDQLLSVWSPHIDHELALTSYEQRFLVGWQQAGDVDDSTRALAVGVAALSARIASNLDFLEIGLHSEAAQVAMDEADSRYGVSSGQFHRILVETAKPHTQLRLTLALQALQQRLSGLRGKGRSKDKPLLQAADSGLLLAEEVEKRYASIAPRLMAMAIGQIAADQLNVLSGAMVTNIALWLGDTRLRASAKSLISAEQAEWLATVAQPGDVLVERRNWYLSNLGLPGFWPHAEFYVGTPAELAAALDSKPEVVAAYGKGGLTGWLQAQLPEVWAHYSEPAADGLPHRVLEAISEGVLFSSVQEAARADYVGVLRPRLSSLDRARAIAKAFSQIGKPYDFDFDFLTTQVLVCSEVVYQAYLPETGIQTGLLLPLTWVMGRQTLPPNDIVRVYDEQWGTPQQQFDFVAFLDGRESTKSALLGTEADLRASWKRPKWDISQL